MALTPVGSAVFLDTTFPQSPFHDAALARLKTLDSDEALFWTSRQVLREYLASTTRPGDIVPVPPLASLLKAVRQFEAEFQIADEDAGVTAHLLDLLETPGAQGKQVHDANIVATMRRYNIPYLLTHNTADFTRYAPGVTVLPLIQ
jgi:predicted nucleic acid-binding protein